MPHNDVIFLLFVCWGLGADGETTEASYPSPNPWYSPLEDKDIVFLISKWESIFLFAGMFFLGIERPGSRKRCQ